MIQSTEGLSIIASKTPVVATHVGGFDSTNAPQTLERYRVEALTYIRPTEIATYQQRFLDRLLTQKTSIGCIVAPFGYGKTSTAIDTWKVCEDNGFLAIPPFSCGSVAEMGKAIATGIIFRIGIGSDGANRVQIAYDAYLVSSAKRLAEQDAMQYKIDFDTALRSIEDKIDRGYLQIDATGTHLLGLLEKLTDIVINVGFRGLLIIVDEFQQFLGNINKTVITNFRTLVWGLRTRGVLPLGLLITMDPDTERNLAERAGDILHRIKEDGLYLDFTDVYDREFARLLWSTYAENFNILSKSPLIVDYATLDAIGQICERHDLSNGPRTVIDLFQRIANLYVTRQRSYTPIDLIDDFMTGAIRFDGDRSKIASLVTELTSYEYIKGSQDRLRTLKLISAFPRGCPKDVANVYGLGQAYEQLSDALRGEVLTELPEGMALIDLQKIGKPQNKLNIILKKYWMQITEDEIITDRAVKLFANNILSAVFTPFKNILSGWITKDTEYLLTSSGSYVQVYEGSFFDEFPKRQICIEVCRQIDQVSQVNEIHDIHFAFVLQRLNEEPIRSSYDRETNSFILGVTINQPFHMQMPRDVRWIEDYLRPVVMSPAVVLSLVDYINTQASKIEGVTENELQRINTHSKKLRDFLISTVFGEELFSGLRISIFSRGEQALRDILFHVLRLSYPDYHTLCISPQWESLCKAYLDALNKVNPVYARGIEPYAGGKTEIASLFGLRNHAGFESQVRQFSDLVDLEIWSGDQAAIRFKRHPGEDLLLKAISIHGGINQAILVVEARKCGYLPEETIYLLEFLLLRGYVERKQDSYFPAKTLSETELRTIAKKCEVEATSILSIVNLSNLESAIIQSRGLMNSLHEINLSEAQIRILQIQRTVQNSRPIAIKKLQDDLGRFRSQLYEKVEKLQKPVPLSSTGLFLDSHINGAQRNISSKTEGIASQLTKLATRANELLSGFSDLDVNNSLELVIVKNKSIYNEFESGLQLAQDLVELISLHSSWIQLAHRLNRIKEYIEILTPLTNMSVFSSRYNSISKGLMEKLSVQGINSYTQIYQIYENQVHELYEDISIDIKAIEIKNKNSDTYTPSIALNADSRLSLRNLLLQEEILFTDVIQRSGLDAESLVKALVDLENDGSVEIKFFSRKFNG